MSDCKVDISRGCKFCNCGSEEDICAIESSSCQKLSSFDWLEGIDVPSDIFEVRFKNTRKGYYKNVNDLTLKRGDVVAVEASPGHDIGIVSMSGEMVRLQMKKTGFNPESVEFKKIYRKAKPYDIVKWQEAIALEHKTMIKSRQVASDLGLNMKIGDVEYQGDKIKAIFYYIADERVDFRELIKIFAEQFKVRIEMKQIGARQEAGRIGGIGACGRELCCAMWMSNFVSVTTNSARFQEISLNPQKLAGQCGKLKCCLNYEVDTYIDARKGIPRINAPLETLDGLYYHVKSDVLRKEMSFTTDPHTSINLTTISVDRAKEIIRLNRKGVKVDSLKIEIEDKTLSNNPEYMNVVGEESITRFDTKNNNNNNNRRRNNRNQNHKGQSNSSSENSDNNKANENVAVAGEDNQRPREGQRPNNNRNNRSGGRNNRRQNPNPRSAEQRKSPEEKKTISDN